MFSLRTPFESLIQSGSITIQSMGCDHKAISSLKLYQTVQLPKLVNRSLSASQRDGRGQRILKLQSHYFIVLLFYAAIAVLPSYHLYAFCLAQLNRASAVAFILSGVLLIRNKNQTKKFVSLLNLCVCHASIFFFHIPSGPCRD